MKKHRASHDAKGYRTEKNFHALLPRARFNPWPAHYWSDSLEWEDSSSAEPVSGRTDDFRDGSRGVRLIPVPGSDRYGTGNFSLPAQGCPQRQRVPRVLPPSGPRSIIQSDDFITSRLCSMIRTEAPPSISLRNASAVFEYRRNEVRWSGRRNIQDAAVVLAGEMRREFQALRLAAGKSVPAWPAEDSPARLLPSTRSFEVILGWVAKKETASRTVI